MTEAPNDLSNLIHQLAQARQVEAATKAELNHLNEEIEVYVEEKYGTQKRLLNGWMEQAEAATKITDEAVRQAALTSYLETGNKRPHPAITVKLYTHLEYDAGLALTYCIQHLPGALKMDARKFEAVAKAAHLSWVTTTEEPKPTIATDLSKYAEEE